MCTQRTIKRPVGLYPVCMFAIAAVLILGASPIANAIVWDGGVGDWTTGSNWDTNVVPTASDTVYINNTGTAQIGSGDAAVATRFYLGNSSGQSGNIELSGGTLTATGNHSYVGNAGTGTFTQTGGTAALGSMALYLGMLSGGQGTYTLTDGSLGAQYLRVGEKGTGLFEHSGGIVTITSQNLIVGRYSPAVGTYNLSGTGQLSAPAEYIGCWVSGTSSIGTFNQSGGTNTVANNLFIGNGGGSNVGGTGTYNLTGGTLSVGGDILDNGTTGTSNFYIDGPESAYNLTVSGGDIEVDHFAVGYAGGTTGEYTLSGGTLTANAYTWVGYNGTGTFTQTGGTHTLVGTSDPDAGDLQLGQQSAGVGTYTFTGGTLDIHDDLYVGLDGTGNFTQSGTSVLSIGDNLGIGWHGGSVGTYILTGGTVTVGNDIADGSGTSNFYIDGPESAYSLTVSGGDIIVDNFAVGYAGGSTGQFTMTAGGPNVSANHEYIGFNGTGTFTQNGGTHSVTTGTGALYLGDNSSGNGTYNLTDGSLEANYLRVGEKGGGLFNQSGGTVTLSTGSSSYDLIVGRYSPAVGTYNLSGGQLSARTEHIGGRASGDTAGPGTGTFNQSGGTNTITYDLYIGNRGGTGTYRLTGGTLNVGGDIIGGTGTSNFYIDAPESAYNLTVSGGDITVDFFDVGHAGGTTGEFTLTNGTLTTNFENIGYHGTGTFTQTGGSNSLTGTTGAIYIGRYAGANGTYTLTDGTLTAKYLRVGESGTGLFDQTGGTVTVTANNLIVGRKTGATGTYNLSGTGQVSAPTEFIGGYEANDDATGTFNQRGGSNTTSGHLQVGYNGGIGTYIISDGDLDVGGTLFVGNAGGTGRFHVVGDQATIETDGYSQNADSTLELDINGISPINVDGTVTLNGFLDVEFLAPPSYQQQFAVIINDSDDLINGTFSGLSEGAVFYATGSGIPLTISYIANFDGTGGQPGNDVVLSTGVPEPSALLLAALGLLSLALYGRRRKKA